MGRRISTEPNDGDAPAIKRGREDAIVWARALVAKGIRVVRLRSSKGAAARPAPAALAAEPRR